MCILLGESLSAIRGPMWGTGPQSRTDTRQPQLPHTLPTIFEVSPSDRVIGGDCLEQTWAKGEYVEWDN